MLAERQRGASHAPLTPQAVRAGIAQRRLDWGKGPDVAAVDDLSVPCRRGALRVRRYQCAGIPRATMLYMHGGGWISGTLDDYDALARAICAQAQCTLLLPDYALAPEHPFPAALDDGEDVMQWVRRQAPYRHVPLIIAGDSAGGNLAAVIAASAAGMALLDGQVLLYPVTDSAMETASYRQFASGYMLTRAEMTWLLEQYAQRTPWTSPRIAPLRAPSLAGAPRAWIASAEFDVLRDEARQYADRLAQDGVAVRYKEYAGMTHGFAPMMNFLDSAAVLIADLGEEIGRMAAATCIQTG